MSFVIEIIPQASFDYIGGVGSIFSAALQTKGLVDQAAILDAFRGSLEWLAAFAYLIAIASAIAAVAIFGNYRGAAYLLIGPTFFFYMITVTVAHNGVFAQYGDRRVARDFQEQNLILHAVRAIENEDGEPGEVRVSFFFALYDSIVSEAVRKIVGFLLNTNNMDDLRYIARERALSFVLNSIPEDRGLAELILTFQVGTCGTEMHTLFREAVRVKNPESEIRNTEDIDRGTRRVKEHFGVRDISLSVEVKRFLVHTQIGIDIDGKSFPANQDDTRPVSCEDIWSLTKEGLFAYADTVLKEGTFRTDASVEDPDPELPIKDAMEDVKAFFDAGTGDNEAAKKLLAVFIWKNAVTKMTSAALQGQIYNHTPSNAKTKESVFGELGMAMEHGGFFTLRFLANSITYIQGTMLYLLTITFPFFAVLLVLPSKATAFFIWCSLWAWVKCWDIGFAIVDSARDIFWHMMKGQTNYQGQELNWENSPESVIQIAFQNDPLVNQGTYYQIASALRVMVPVVSAYFFKGAPNLFEAFSKGIVELAERFGAGRMKGARRHEANVGEKALQEAVNGMGETSARIAMKETNAETVDGQYHIKNLDHRTEQHNNFDALKSTGENKNGAKTVTDGFPRWVALYREFSMMQLLIAKDEDFEGAIDEQVAAFKDVDQVHPYAGFPSMTKTVHPEVFGRHIKNLKHQRDSLQQSDRFGTRRKALARLDHRINKLEADLKAGKMPTIGSIHKHEANRVRILMSKTAVATGRRQADYVNWMAGRDTYAKYLNGQMGLIGRVRNFYSRSHPDVTFPELPIPFIGNPSDRVVGEKNPGLPTDLNVGPFAGGKVAERDIYNDG